jgi:hypothetical protein
MNRYSSLYATLLILPTLIPVLSHPVYAQWVQRTSTASPAKRIYPALAYDSLRQKTVLFGGWDAPNTTTTSTFGDTWEWDGANWTEVPLAKGPTRRSGHAMAYDAQRSRVVLFGGEEKPHSKIGMKDTWEWDGANWMNVTPANGNPPARLGHAMTYDSVRQRIVMFGGLDGGTHLNDIWEWNGTAWAEITPTTTRPDPRIDLPIAYDPSQQVTIVYGGSNGLALSDMWTWDGTAWSSVNTTPSSPGPRRNHYMAFDTTRGRLVLFGGSDGSNRFADTWEWSNNTWTERQFSPKPSARASGAMAYDSARQRMVLFGGQNSSQTNFAETWEYGTSPPQVFPPALANVEGNSAYGGIFVPPRSRTQCLLEANGFGSPSFGSIKAIELRRDRGNPPEAFRARNTDMKVTFGAASTTAETMSTTFANNYSGTPSIVFPRGTFNTPAQTTYPGVTPFNIRIPFSQPFTWSGQDLVYEIEVFSNQMTGAGSYNGYELDAESTPRPSGNGVVFPLGTSCKGPNGTAPTFVLPSGRDVVLGGTFTNTLAGATPNSTAANFWGHSTTLWNNVPLPIAWMGTNCLIYTNPLIGPFFTKVDVNGQASVSYPIPNKPGLGGLTLHSQWGVVEASTAWPPLTLTNAATFIVGQPSTSFYDSVATLSGSGTGVKPTGGWSVVVTRLTY